MAKGPTDPDNPKAEGETAPKTHHVTATVSVTADVTATVVTARELTKIYIFRCANKSDLYAVSRNPAGDNLPENVCAGEWVRFSEADVERGGHVAGFVSGDLFRDLDRQGFHLASGVRVTVSRHHHQTERAVRDALSAANARTKFFATDTDA
jgi:hypothetical protein